MKLAALSELFPDAGYGFSMRLRPGDPAEFFAPSANAGSILSERKRWIGRTPDKYSALEPAFESVVEPLIGFAKIISGGAAGVAPAERTPIERLRRLGCEWEPDFLVLTPGATGQFMLRAGCVCFPSGWALAEKIGRSLEEIHGVVPGLNSGIGAKIHQFLARLKPGGGWSRSNWGISSSAEFNQHPDRALNRLTPDTLPESTWLRLEHQMLTALPGTSAILFGIRLENVSLVKVKQDAVISRGLRRALATMPDEMAAYKNLATIRPALIAYLA